MESDNVARERTCVARNRTRNNSVTRVAGWRVYYPRQPPSLETKTRNRESCNSVWYSPMRATAVGRRPPEVCSPSPRVIFDASGDSLPTASMLSSPMSSHEACSLAPRQEGFLRPLSRLIVRPAPSLPVRKAFAPTTMLPRQRWARTQSPDAMASRPLELPRTPGAPPRASTR